MPTNKQRREAARRHLERQLQKRQQQAARRRQRNLIVTIVGTVVVLVVVIVAVVMSNSDSKKKKTATATASGPCDYVASGTAAKNVGVPPDPKPTPTTTRTLSVATNLGNITMTLNGAAAPCNVQSIAYLAGKGYYDATKCHRLVTTGIYVLQCGDPKGDGSGGPGYSTKDENLTAADYSQPGTIAMANSGADTNGSQFFIIYKDSSAGLAKSYTVIGKVTAGMDIVNKVAAAGATGTTGDGAPKLAITFTKVTVNPAVKGSGALESPTTAAASSAPVSDVATAPASTPVASTPAG